jgi:hypothetical protein
MAHQDANKNKNNKNNNDSHSPEQLSNSQSQDPLHFLRHAKFSPNDAAPTSADSQPLTASDLLLGAHDPLRLHPLAQIGDHLDYLSLDDDKSTDLPGAETLIPSRGWRDDLCYGTGTMYLSGTSYFISLSISHSGPLCFFVKGSPIHPLSCPQLSYCFLHHVLISFTFKVWLWAACGVCVRAPKDL